MPARVRDQLAIDERVLEEPEIEARLEARMRAGDDLAEIRKVFLDADAAARGSIAGLDLTPGQAIRVGRFRVTKVSTPARHADFDVKAGTRVRINLAKE